MKVKALMSIYTGENTLIRKDSVFEIPDEPVVEKVNPRTKTKHMVPEMFSFRSMEKVDEDEPLNPIRKPKPHLKRIKPAAARGPLPEGTLRDGEDDSI